MFKNRRLFGLSAAVLGFAGLCQLAACTTDDTDKNAGTGGKDGAGGSSDTSSGGASANAGGSGNTAAGGSSATPSGTVCSNPIVLGATNTGLINFDTYDGATALATWSIALGGDSSLNAYCGPFAYGDRPAVGDAPQGMPETFDTPTGAESTKYGLRIADTNAQKWGGGMGVWISACLNATKFKGISFWARGNAPTGKAKFSILMQETTPAVAAKTGDKVGTCSGTAKTCIHPYFNFTVSEAWTQVQIPWASFTAGDAAGTAVIPDGRNITQVQFDIGLNWMPDAAGTYQPVAAPYELAVDTIAFY